MFYKMWFMIEKRHLKNTSKIEKLLFKKFLSIMFFRNRRKNYFNKLHIRNTKYIDQQEWNLEFYWDRSGTYSEDELQIESE